MAANRTVCTTGEGIHLLPRLPGLAAPVLRFDLRSELQQLRQKDSWKRETGRSSKTLAKYPDLRVVLILMKGGTRMRQRRAAGRVSIQSLDGLARVHMASGNVTLQAGQLLILDCGVLHDVEALQESALLLSLSWQTQKAKLPKASIERRLDDEALSRMDNEGGARALP